MSDRKMLALAASAVCLGNVALAILEWFRGDWSCMASAAAAGYAFRLIPIPGVGEKWNGPE